MSFWAGTTKEQGYDSAHKRLRRRWARDVELGGVACWRCGEPIPPGSDWDLGHDDDDRSLYRGPEHRKCNRGTSGRGRLRLTSEEW